MQMEIDIGSLSEDERYHLSNGLKALKNPSQSCRKVIAELSRLATESFNKFCKENPFCCY